MPVHTNTPLYLCMQRPHHHTCVYTGSLSHVYTEPLFTHMHVKALSHMCTQESHHPIRVHDPCPMCVHRDPINWYVPKDLSWIHPLHVRSQGHRVCTYRNPFLVYTQEPHHACTRDLITHMCTQTPSCMPLRDCITHCTHSNPIVHTPQELQPMCSHGALHLFSFLVL